MKCRHLWRVRINFGRSNEHSLCLQCPAQLPSIKVTKREKKQ